MDVREELKEDLEARGRRHPLLTVILLVIILVGVVALAVYVVGVPRTRASLKTALLLGAILTLLAAGLLWSGGSSTAVKGSPFYLTSESAREAVLAAEEAREEPHDPMELLVLTVVGVTLLGLGLLL